MLLVNTINKYIWSSYDCGITKNFVKPNTIGKHIRNFTRILQFKCCYMKYKIKLMIIIWSTFKCCIVIEFIIVTSSATPSLTIRGEIRDYGQVSTNVLCKKKTSNA